MRLHDLRRTTATLLRVDSVDLRVITQILGHSALAVTSDIYSHVALDEQRAALRRLGMLTGEGDVAVNDCCQLRLRASPKSGRPWSCGCAARDSNPNPRIKSRLGASPDGAGSCRTRPPGASGCGSAAVSLTPRAGRCRAVPGPPLPPRS